MADVFLAQDTRLHRTVAVKVLRSDLARDSSFQERFRREAHSAASLNHPSIVAVYDTGEEQQTTITGAEVTIPYIVMEYVDGDTLREHIDPEHPMDAQQAGEIMAALLSALEYSHRAGIVHRDIKPGNIMINEAGAVKVMDFGIARAIADATSAMTADPGRDGHRPVPLPRAGPRPAGRCPLRHLLRRLRDVRDDHRPSAVHRRHPGLHRATSMCARIRIRRRPTPRRSPRHWMP